MEWCVQGLGFAIVGNLRRLWVGAERTVFGEPKRCPSCGKHLLYLEEAPWYASGLGIWEPAYYCPWASYVAVVRYIRDYVVVDCNR